MNLENPYNLTYSQFPNMSYRMMSLWYAGFAFALFIFMFFDIIKKAISNTDEKRFLWLIALCIFLSGTLVHLPVMHRDYFHIPGYLLGYKISIGFVGFVFLSVLYSSVIFEGVGNKFFTNYRFIFMFLILLLYVVFSAS